MKCGLSHKINVGQSVQPRTVGSVVYTHLVKTAAASRDRSKDSITTVCGLTGHPDEWRVIKSRKDNFDNNKIVYCDKCAGVVGNHRCSICHSLITPCNPAPWIGPIMYCMPCYRRKFVVK